MGLFVALGALITILVVYSLLRDRIDALGRELRLEAKSQRDVRRRDIAELARRIDALQGETGGATPPSEQEQEPSDQEPVPRGDRVSPTIAAGPPPVAMDAPRVVAAPPVEAQPQAASPNLAAARTTTEPGAKTAAPPATGPPAAASPTPAPAGPGRSAADIEALIGGDWLNKLGVLVLVIGLALTLGYSFTYMGPAGRVAIGLVVSAGLLAAGRVFERKENYRLYGSGLIGGGWAALYFTTYAMHGLEAARVVTNPIAGFALLLAVALAMILSSLRYRSEVVTGLAFIVAFATLAVSPNSSFGIFASLPLAAGLLVVAHRFEWVRLAFVGVLATYGVYMFAPGEAPDTGSRLGDFLAGETVLVLYWVLFEAFDLLRPIHRIADSEALADGPAKLVPGDVIFPLNATAFLGVSVLQWLAVDAEMLDLFLPLATLVFLASALVRGRVRPPAHEQGLDPVQRLLVGYGGAATLSTGLGVLAIFERFSGQAVNVALLLEAQVLFVCGLYLGRRLLRGLAALVFAVAWSSILGGLFSGTVTIVRFGAEDWTFMALAGAAVLYVNRAWSERARSSPAMTAEKSYSFAATLLLVLAILIEAPEPFLETAWLGLAAILLEVGLRARAIDLRIQAYGLSGLAFSVLMVWRVLGSVAAQAIDAVRFDSTAAWFVVAIGAVAAILLSVRVHQASAADDPGGLSARERVAARAGFVVAATVLTMSFLWQVLPAAVVVLAWGAIALLLIERGRAVGDSAVRLLGNTVMAAVFARLFWTNFWLEGTTAGLPDRVLTALPVIALAYYLAARVGAAPEGESEAWERNFSRIYLWIVFPAVLALVGIELTLIWIGPVWAVYFLGLLMAGRRWLNDDLRAQSYLLVLPILGVCQQTNVDPERFRSLLFGPAGHAVLTHAVAVGTAAISFYLARALVHFGVWKNADADTDRDASATIMVAAAATLLVSLTLVHEVDGSMLTVALGIQGALLMGVGFLLADRVFRLSGLVLLGVCVLKAFAYDLSELDPIFRILSFVVLGLLLLGVSFIYTRYREKLQRFL